jgi:uncharacterized protein YraI
MKKQILLAGAALVTAGFLVAAPAYADSIKGYTNSNVGLLAGPGLDYPTVSEVQSGVNVDIHGCVQGFLWCDVDWNGQRGWIEGRFLDSIYKDKRASIITSGSQENVPTVVWEQRTYWDNNYRDRPFYTERRYWTSSPP